MDNNNFNDMGNGFESSYSNQSNMNNYNGQPFVPPAYNGPSDPLRPAYADGGEDPVSVGEWIIVFLISMIPCINIIMVFVWAFSKNEKASKSNYFKASLIMAAVIVGLSFVFGFFGAMLQ